MIGLIVPFLRKASSYVIFPPFNCQLHTSKQNLIKSMGNFMNSLQLQLKCGSLLLLASVRPLISFINFSEKEHANVLCLNTN